MECEPDSNSMDVQQKTDIETGDEIVQIRQSGPGEIKPEECELRVALTSRCDDDVRLDDPGDNNDAELCINPNKDGLLK